MNMDNHFVHNLLVFARLLRWLGIPVSAEQVSDLGRVMRATGVAQREDVYYLARAIFVRRREDLARFDRAFELFFSVQGKPQQPVIDPTASPVKRVMRPKNIQAMIEREMRERENKPGVQDQESQDEDKTVYSPSEVLRQKDFEQFTSEEVIAARHLIAEMDWRIGKRKTRRMQSVQHGTRADFSRLIRRNLKYGGELFHLPKRANKLKTRPLIVLADISGSMERYTRMVLHLVHALSQQALAPRGAGVTRVEVFVFGTRLTRITADLKKRSVDAALARVAQRVPDWSGGTRIGEAIKTFNFKWARRLLHAGAVVLILSDGWDCGDVETLRDEMSRLQRSCARLMWLHPSLGKPTFEPSTLGLQVALPFVDDFLPVRNLISLEMLVKTLAMVGESTPVRRQRPYVPIPVRLEEKKQQFMERPQMGTSDYVRRTLTIHSVNGVTTFRYAENPDENAQN